ncbi:hypothetical protein BOTBODRAFT_177830 [Botryobasidium botryosum FD-172 SS1]|uniref:SNF2 N-terminal domain-containing protein n=1 Tax=Botryobasidium botryosum (strain FD-172 SS1) TaxID=930990 RepID=A0A067MGD9_BOTB1|nr:hypothetical protein BOTBODRAFT_177830 [Botryobasidium botryosum FD-172 SS1]
MARKNTAKASGKPDGKSDGKATQSGGASSPATATPSYTNLFLIPGELHPGYPWSNNSFQAISGLTEKNFLDPDYRDPKGDPLDKEILSSIATFYDQVKNEPKITRKARLSNIPGYASYRDTLTAHFKQPGNVDEAIMTVMNDMDATYLQVWIAAGRVAVTAGEYNSTVSGAIAEHLFGEEVFLGQTSNVKAEFTRFGEHAHYRLWHRQRDATKRRHTKREKAISAFGAELADLESARTPASFRKASSTLAKLKRFYALDGDAENEDYLGMERSLKAFLDKGPNLMAQNGRDTLWTAAQIEQAALEWFDAFSRTPSAYEDFTPPLPPGPALFSDGEDIGVDDFSAWFKPELYRYLGFDESGRVPFWRVVEGKGDFDDILQATTTEALSQWLQENKGRYTVPQNRPDPRGPHRTYREFYPEERIGMQLPQGYSLIRLRLHQLQALAALVKRTWHAGLPPGSDPKSIHSTLSTLIADEVGLGKTALTLAFFSTLMHYFELSRQEKPLPPIVGLSIFGKPSGKELWKMPFVVIANKNLVEQWNAESRRFLAPGTDSIIYDPTTKERLDWWIAPGRSWSTAQTELGRRILLITGAASTHGFKPG